MTNRFVRAAVALGLPAPRNLKTAAAKALAVVVALSSLFLNVGMAEAATLANSSVALSDPRPSQTGVSYTFTGGATGGLVTSSLIKCIKVVVSTTSAGTTAPTGFDLTSATIGAGSTLINSSTSGWTAATSGTTGNRNTLQYTNTTGITPSTTTGATFILNAITNSSVADTSYFYKLNTYNNTDCTSAPVDNALVMFINTNGSTLSLTVDPTLTFTVNAVAASQTCAGATSTQASTSTTIPFGTVSAASNGLICQDLIASTNATNGYTIYIRDTAAPTNANGQAIADWTGTNAAPTTFAAAGTEAYGYSTNDTTLGTGTAGRFAANKFAAASTTNAELAYEAAGVTSTTYRVAHQVGIATTTKPGTYSTTVIYTCTPVY